MVESVVQLATPHFLACFSETRCSLVDTESSSLGRRKYIPYKKRMLKDIISPKGCNSPVHHRYIEYPMPNLITRGEALLEYVANVAVRGAGYGKTVVLTRPPTNLSLPLVAPQVYLPWWSKKATSSHACRAPTAPIIEIQLTVSG